MCYRTVCSRCYVVLSLIICGNFKVFLIVCFMDHFTSRYSELITRIEPELG